MSSPQTQGQGLQERQAIEKLAHDNQGQDWQQFLRNLNTESSKGQQIPRYYGSVSEAVEDNYQRLPQAIKDAVKSMPPEIQSSYFTVCGWVARTTEQHGEQTGSSVAHFLASTIEQSTKALSGMGGTTGGSSGRS